MKKIISTLLLLGIIINQAPVIQADSISNNDTHFASTLAIRYTWRYKFENGKLKIGLSAGIGFNLTMKLW